MKRKAAALAAAMSLGLSACQTTGAGVDYVKVGKGPALDAAKAECKAISDKAAHVVIGIGGPEALAIGLIGTAVATAAKRAQVFEQCMTLQGYQKAGARGAPQPAPAPPPPAGQKAAKPTPASSAPAKPAPKRAG